MIPEQFIGLAEQVDEVFFLIGVAILVIEIAEAWFKGSLKGKTWLEMLASASTQVPYLLLEATMMTGLLDLKLSPACLAMKARNRAARKKAVNADHEA